MPDPITISGLPDIASLTGDERVPLDKAGAVATAGSFVIGQGYQIVSVGSTDFVAVGAATNTVGVYFVATGAGTGTGTATAITTGDAAVSAIAALASPPRYVSTTTYTASGAISIADQVAIINAASAVTMTLASGSSDGQSLLVKRFGAGAVTITAGLDGSNFSIVADSLTIKESVVLAWSSSLSTWLIL